MYVDAVHPFDALMALPDKHIRLGSAALWFGTDRYPELAVDHYLRRLDRLAEQVRDAAGGDLTASGRLDALADALVYQEGFTGDIKDYYDPRNAYLQTALDRRKGLPITLAVIWLDVAGQLGWPLKGIGFPGHFLVGYRNYRGRMMLVDPFGNGRRLQLKDCRQLLAGMVGKPVALRKSFFKPLGVRTTIFRMLANLRSIYERAGQHNHLRNVLSRMVATGINCPEVISALAEALRRDGQILPALSAMYHLREQRLSPTQTRLVSGQIAQLERLQAEAN